jgi:hypothetical protein
MTDKEALLILWRFYIDNADDYEGLVDDLGVTFLNGSTVQDLAKECLECEELEDEDEA